MRYIMVTFTDTSVLECERVRDSHRYSVLTDAE